MVLSEVDEAGKPQFYEGRLPGPDAELKYGAPQENTIPVRAT
jgi:hypothetical protein